MKFKGAIIVGTILAVTAGAIWFRAARAELLKLYGGPAGFAALQSPERVEAYRLSHSIGREPTVTEGPVAVNPSVAKQLGTVLSAHGAYGWNFAKGCVPVWGVRLSFYRGTDRVDVLLCFECDILRVSLNGTNSGNEDFDPIRPHLLRVLREIFPDDQEIKTLPEHL
jgi:hypothetical protein